MVTKPRKQGGGAVLRGGAHIIFGRRYARETQKCQTHIYIEPYIYYLCSGPMFLMAALRFSKYRCSMASFAEMRRCGSYTSMLCGSSLVQAAKQKKTKTSGSFTTTVQIGQRKRRPTRCCLLRRAKGNELQQRTMTSEATDYDRGQNDVGQ